MEPQLRVQVEDTVIRVEGELDMATAPILHCCLEMISQTNILLDVSELEFIDARGVGVVVHAAHRLEEEGYHLAITGAQPLVRRVLELTEADSLCRDHWPAAS